MCSVLISGLSDSSVGRIEPAVPVYSSSAQKTEALNKYLQVSGPAGEDEEGGGALVRVVGSSGYFYATLPDPEPCRPPLAR